MRQRCFWAVRRLRSCLDPCTGARVDRLLLPSLILSDLAEEAECMVVSDIAGKSENDKCLRLKSSRRLPPVELVDWTKVGKCRQFVQIFWHGIVMHG